jgi:PAS domain S-box-containing protein
MTIGVPAVGEMEERIRAFDWGSSRLGPMDQWPTSLRTMVGVVLGSRFPMNLWWGPELVHIYNDAYRVILGDKHPASLGAPGAQVWHEIWHIIGPMAESIMAGGPATWSEHLLLPMRRRGFVEETYFTFSYSPIPGDDGSVDGVLITCQETTKQVQSERQLRTLRDLASHATLAVTPEDACEAAARTLSANDTDVPFAMLYVVDGDGTSARLVCSAGLDDYTGPGNPTIIALSDNPDDELWPLSRSIRSGRMAVATDVWQRGGAMPGGAWPEHPHTAVVVPLARSGEPRPYGFLVAGVSARRELDEPYAGFFQLAADGIATALANAHSHQDARERADALLALDRAKTAFFSNISHEFRTPLTLMLGPTEEALVSPEGALKGKNLELVHRNELRLLRLVNALLDFSRIEAGRMQARFRLTDLGELTADLASMFRAAVERAGLTLDVRFGDLRGPVYVDRTMWEHIVLNLLSNALKFTFDGAIRLWLEQTDDGIELHVADTGIGIAEEDMPKLFQRFHRIAGARSRTQEGSGIGLAMVHELVRLHGGAITVQSRQGQGTEFVVTLPDNSRQLTDGIFVENEEDAHEGHMVRAFVQEAMRWGTRDDRAEVPMVPSAALAAPNARVLVVDDNADMREYLLRLLQPHFRVDTASGGAEALERMRELIPDLVLTDIMMPDMDGTTLLEQMRGDALLRHVPVIMLSARAGDEARAEGIELGADDYLVKPFSPRELIARVGAHVSLARTAQERSGLLERERLARLELELQKQRLHDLFMQAPTLIALLRGPNHVVELANEGICALWGRTQAQVLGQPIMDVLWDLEGQGFRELMDHVYQTGEPYEGRETPARFTRADGSVETVYFNFVYSAMRNVHGEIDGVFVVASDVSDQVLARQELERLRRSAESANRAKDEFLAILGHELRNPLSPILTALQLMQLRGDGGERERTVIERQVAHLTRLVDDLLDVSRIAGGKVELKREVIELGAVVARAIEMASPLLERRTHMLTMEVARTGTPVDVDVTRIAQVIANLLTNAAKYTPAGGNIIVTSRVVRDQVELSVRDDGIGISPEVLPQVFDLFVQERQGLDRADGGLGLGLTIVRNLVQLHGGSVAAFSSGAGQGSEFIVRLPLARRAADVQVHKRSGLRITPRASAPQRILVVDDNEDSAVMLSNALRMMGHDVRVAYDGPTALQIAQEFHPRTAFLDIGLPVMDGYELSARLRALDDSGEMRLFALTGYGQEADRQRSREAGFQRHLVKPLDIVQLREVLEPAAPLAEA